MTSPDAAKRVRKSEQPVPTDDFSTDRATLVLSAAAERCSGLLKALGRCETALLEYRLPQVERPVYIAGLARAGSTLLLEILNWHDDIATHRYRDFPLLHTPVLWHTILTHAGSDAGELRERAHADGMLVNRESPEAFEEVLWMDYFPHIHSPSSSNVLGRSTSNPRFERNYVDHIRKLLLLRGGRRYAAKGNYNVTRLAYLHSLFPDARFVVPVRDPYWHVASLMKQQQRFVDGQCAFPDSIPYLRRAGHFEFGIDRRPINTGDHEAMQQVLSCWKDGREAEGWARYWCLIYDHVAACLESDPVLARSTMLVPYEALCRQPEQTTALLFEHCQLELPDGILESVRGTVRFPDYYKPALTREERQAVAAQTRQTFVRLRRYMAPFPGLVED